MMEEINLKTIYKIFKSEIQNHIKKIAEEHCIDPLQALIRFDEAASSELDNKLNELGIQLYGDYGINPKTAFEFFENFKSEIYDAISPDWNSTIKNESYNTYLNRRLVEEGYDSVNFEVLDFLFEEFKQTKIVTTEAEVNIEASIEKDSCEEIERALKCRMNILP